MLYGTLIRTLRRRCGLTPRQLGDYCGLTASAIGMIEQGRRLPGRRADERLRQFFARYGGCLPLRPRQPIRRAELLELLRAAPPTLSVGGGPHRTVLGS
ncbi:MAG: helix-turn-helix transcriptional regulator [Angelakisella sp.]|nr:helix-turn-helix transcriptional regulator [Angelakisella sp.]